MRDSGPNSSICFEFKRGRKVPKRELPPISVHGYHITSGPISPIPRRGGPRRPSLRGMVFRPDPARTRTRVKASGSADRSWCARSPSPVALALAWRALRCRREITSHSLRNRSFPPGARKTVIYARILPYVLSSKGAEKPHPVAGVNLCTLVSHHIRAFAGHCEEGQHGKNEPVRPGVGLRHVVPRHEHVDEREVNIGSREERPAGVGAVSGTT